MCEGSHVTRPLSPLCSNHKALTRTRPRFHADIEIREENEPGRVSAEYELVEIIFILRGRGGGEGGGEGEGYYSIAQVVRS